MRLKVGQMFYNKYETARHGSIESWRLPVGMYKVIEVGITASRDGTPYWYVCVEGSAKAMGHTYRDTYIRLAQERFLVRRSFLAYNPQNKANRGINGI